MGKGGYGKGKGGYDWRQHTHASDDPAVQNECRERCERIMRAEPGYSEQVEAWGRERQTYKRYCLQFGLSFQKSARGYFEITKLDPSAGSPFADMLEVFRQLSDGKSMLVTDLLWEVKQSHPDLWQRLNAKGVNNVSAKKLTFHEDEVKRYFDISHDWQTLAAKGELHGEIEYAKPLYLTSQEHGSMIKAARQGMEQALRAVPWRRRDNQSGAKDLFCVFNEASNKNRTRRVLQQQTSDAYARMLVGRKRLPAFQRKDVIVEKFDNADVLVICGATGCGKTTQLPQILMEILSEREDPSRILCTQPRRISATSVAERVAQERGEKIGGSVGYQIRFEHRATADTSLLYCTVGILLRHLASNPTLDGVGVVVVDEVHERDVHTDFVLLILRDLVLGPRRGSLKLVLMSATINAQGFIDYFQQAIPGPDSQEPEALSVSYFEIPGKTNYPIEEYWVEDILESLLPEYVPAGPPPPRRNAAQVQERHLWSTEPGAISRRLKGQYSEETCTRLQNILRRPMGKADLALVAEIVFHIAVNEGPGAILIFVPGWQDIADCIKELERRGQELRDFETWTLFPLHSMVPPRDQNAIFRVLPEGERKIIVSTNIAETSITVEDVVFVVDTGLIKGTTYTPNTNVATLEALQISRSNAQQRRGRAGRCQPGKFFRLYSQIDWEEMADSMPPEMQRTPVEELCLQVKALELPGSIEQVLGKAIDPPATRAVSNALFLLRSLGALDDDEVLTPLGWKLALLPIHPSLGKMMLLGSLFDCMPELLSVCGTLSCKSPFVMPFGKEKEADAAKKWLGEGLQGDHLLFAKVVAMWHRKSPGEKNQFCFKNFLSDRTLQQVEKTRHDLHQYVVDLKLRPKGERLPPGDDRLAEPRCAEILCVLASSLPLATRPPSQRKFKCLEVSHAACAVHPSSLMEQLSSPKRKTRDATESYGVLCWFSRLKTAELYLHDVSVLADMLPLLLLSPHVNRRDEDPAVFEVVAPVQDDDDPREAATAASEMSWEAKESIEEEDVGAPPPPLLVRLSDPAVADDLWALRERLNELVDRIIGQPPIRLPAEVTAAFQALRPLVHSSYKLHGQDHEACEAFGGDDEQQEAARGGEDRWQRRGRQGGKGGGGGGGYPWWQHIKSKGGGKGGGGGRWGGGGKGNGGGGWQR